MGIKRVSRQERRLATKRMAKQILKERGWPRHRLAEVWRSLMLRYPDNPYRRGGLYDQAMENARRRAKARVQMLETSLELTPDQLAQMRKGSPLHRSRWERFVIWIRKLLGR